jgi:N-acetylmuramoyl-L-alanine amidase
MTATSSSACTQAQGVEIFYSAPQPGLDAAAIAQSLANAIFESTGTACHGVRQAKLSLFRDLDMPGVLIEMGYLTNPADVALLADEAHQQRLADGIAAGLAPFVANAAAPEPAS